MRNNLWNNEEADRSLSCGAFKTVCQMCGYEMCGMSVFVRRGRIIKIAGNKEFPFNRGKLCPKGFAAKELINHPKRLRYPIMKKGEDWKRITWGDALDFIAEKLTEVKAKYGAESLVLVKGACKLNESEDALLRRFMNLFGTPNIVSLATVCQYPRAFVDRITAGSPFHRYLDLANTDCIICWGSNPSASHFPTTWMDILNAKQRGAKLIVVDPRVTSTASQADIHVQPRPGTDGALALGLLNVVIHEGLHDEDFVEGWTIGFEELAELVEEYTPERVEEITWVPRDLIAKIARMYAKTRRACMFLGNSLDHTTNAIQNLRAIDILIAVTGHLDVPGGNVFWSPIPLTDISLGEKLPEDARFIETKYPLYTAGVHMGTMIDVLTTKKPYPVKAMIINYSNPMMTWPNTKNVEKGLNALDFLVVMDLFMTPTAELADIVLPATTFLERTRLLTYSGRPSLVGGKSPRYITLAGKVVDPIGECWPDWKFWLELAQRLGYEEYFPWREIEEIIAVQLKPTGISLENLKKFPSGTYYGQTMQFKKYAKNGFQTPSGKVEIHSSVFEKFGYNPLPVYREPIESPISNPNLAKEYPFILLTGAKLLAYSHSSWRKLPSLRKLESNSFAEINKKTAEDLMIKDGDKMIVETKRCGIEIRAKITDKILPKVVHIPHGWPEGNANLLTDHEMCDPILGCIALNTLLCRLKKAPSIN